MKIRTANNYFVRLLGKQRMINEMRPMLFHVMEKKEDELEYQFDMKDVKSLRFRSMPFGDNANLQVDIEYENAYLYNVFQNKIISSMYDLFYEFFVYITMHSFLIKMDLTCPMVNTGFQVKIDKDRMKVNTQSDINDNIDYCIRQYSDKMKTLKLRWVK